MAAASSLSPGKRTVIEILVGGVLGFVGWSVLGPRMISWWYQPPAQEAISCGPSVELALSQFVHTELIITIIGAATVALLSFFVRRWLRGRAAGNSGTTPA